MVPARVHDRDPPTATHRLRGEETHAIGDDLRRMRVRVSQIAAVPTPVISDNGVVDFDLEIITLHGGSFTLAALPS